MRLTPFESEIVDSILCQIEGLRKGRVTPRATMRILRATLRRIRPRVVAQSPAVESSKVEIDHSVPVYVICDRILATSSLDREKLEGILDQWLVAVALSVSEHRQTLKQMRLQSRMPKNWDGKDRMARYRAAGITLVEMAEELLKTDK